MPSPTTITCPNTRRYCVARAGIGTASACMMPVAVVISPLLLCVAPRLVLINIPGGAAKGIIASGRTAGITTAVMLWIELTTRAMARDRCKARQGWSTEGGVLLTHNSRLLAVQSGSGDASRAGGGQSKMQGLESEEEGQEAGMERRVPECEVEEMLFGHSLRPVRNTSLLRP